jgi:hypothetical protein
VNDFIRGRQVYLLYCLALLRPGRIPPDLPIDRTAPAAVSGWQEGDLALLIEEGRRHVDRLLGEIDKTRDRAQVGLTGTLALLVITAAQLPAAKSSWSLLALFSVSAFLLSLGFCAFLSVAVVQVRVGVIHAGVLSTYTPPVGPQLAQDYAEVSVDTQNAASTMLSVLREAALYVTLGAAVLGALWIARHV